MRHRCLLTIAVTAAGLLAATGCKANARDSAEPSQARTIEAQANEAGAARASTPHLAEQSRVTIPVTEVNGIRIAELSDLAWDDDEQLLYAVSDQGNVIHFRLELDGDAIVKSEPVYAAALADPEGVGSPRRRFNAEGLTVQNANNSISYDTVLVVSLEGGDLPSIIRFSPAGVMLEDLAVPQPANDPRNYLITRRGLESVAYHPVHGLMTAPESPLVGWPETQHVVYASGRHWSFARYSANSRVKAFDMLENGGLLVLERSRLDSSDSLTASLRHINLADCREEDVCNADDLVVLPAGPINFEGMTHLGNGRVLIVSDHGGDSYPGSATLILLAPQ